MRAVGMGARELKRRAAAYITATDQGKAAAENAVLQKKTQDQQEQISDLQSKMAELMAAAQSKETCKVSSRRASARAFAITSPTIPAAQLNWGELTVSEVSITKYRGLIKDMA